VVSEDVLAASQRSAKCIQVDSFGCLSQGRIAIRPCLPHCLCLGIPLIIQGENKSAFCSVFRKDLTSNMGSPIIFSNTNYCAIQRGAKNMETINLSTRQKKILKFIAAFLKQNGYPPTIREIGEAVDIASTSVVNYNLNKLVERGLIERAPEVSRGLRCKPGGITGTAGQTDRIADLAPGAAGRQNRRQPARPDARRRL